MQLNVGESIAALLFENDSVIIPGLGGFTSEYKSADIDHVQGKLSPPTKKLFFNPNLLVDDGLLIGDLAKKHDISFEETRQLLRQYVKNVKSELEKGEIVVFPELGRIYKDFAGKFQFLQDDTNFNADAFGLPEVHYQSISKSSGAAEVVTPKPTPVASSSNKQFMASLTDWVQRNLLWIIVGIAIIVTVSLYMGLKTNGSISNDALVDTPGDRTNISPLEIEGDENDDDELLNDIEIIYDSLEENSSDLSEDAIDTEGATPLPDQKVCIIAIGLFGNQGNVDKLMRKIVDEGYNVYFRKEGKLTRVGVQFPYDDEEEINLTLREIRDKFEPDARVLEE